jgi:hypothetical protein
MNMNKLLIAAAAMAGAAFAPIAAWAAPQDFTIVNHTGHSVLTLNVSATASNEWGPDILGVEVLHNGESGHVSFDPDEDHCLYDIRVTYDDGDTGDWRRLNLCQLSTIELTA